MKKGKEYKVSNAAIDVIFTPGLELVHLYEVQWRPEGGNVEDVPKEDNLDVEFNDNVTVVRDMTFGVVEIVSHLSDRTISPGKFISRQDMIGPFQLQSAMCIQQGHLNSVFALQP